MVCEGVGYCGLGEDGVAWRALVFDVCDMLFEGIT